MTEFSVSVSCGAACGLDRVTEVLDSEGIQLRSISCACVAEGDRGVVSFSVSDPERVRDTGLLERLEAQEAGSIIFVRVVPNQQGCCTDVVSALSKSGASIRSLACACAAEDESGILAVGLRSR